MFVSDFLRHWHETDSFGWRTSTIFWVHGSKEKSYVVETGTYHWKWTGQKQHKQRHSSGVRFTLSYNYSGWWFLANNVRKLQRFNVSTCNLHHNSTRQCSVSLAIRITIRVYCNSKVPGNSQVLNHARETCLRNFSKVETTSVHVPNSLKVKKLRIKQYEPVHYSSHTGVLKVKFCGALRKIQCVPLATEPGISLIILPLMNN